MKHWVWVATLMVALTSAQAEAKLYRWVDEQGNVQFSDKPPVQDPKGGVSELNKSGTVRKGPTAPPTEEEKLRAKEAELLAKEQKRRDKALLQSFTKPEEIDLLRDRQIEAIQATIQTNKLKRQTLVDRQTRLNKQAERYTKQKKPLPSDLEAEFAVAKKDIDDIDRDTIKRNAEIEEVKKRAEQDKRRFIELQAR
ncbi:DUF4124 domain-containing protein [Chitinolyticbacter albus]|uniref:DUF4124 domain-containing protein n=1 Tax=Chitinolyticbacter albus TaxID=2961951 RepID=UPI0021098D8D|nr:DUF4124 domain-containing protein [Chitinolyticbacter albus]